MATVMEKTVTMENLQTFVDTMNATKPEHTYTIDKPGSKFVRVIVQFTPDYSKDPANEQKSSYMFVRLADGAVLKCASWKVPAVGERAWLNSKNAVELATNADRYGRWLYKR